MHLMWKKRMTFRLTLMLTILLLVRIHNTAAEELVITHGVASGDVTAHSAIVWARASGPAQMHVEYDTDLRFGRPKRATPVEATGETDLTAQVRLHGLKPDTRYFYQVWFTGPEGSSESQVGTFQAAPAPGVNRPVSFVFGGDLGGQRYCRRVGVGYAIFAAMEALAPDFFVANGDMIYGDGDCPEDGPDGPGGWQNIPGDFPSVSDPAVNWTDIETVRALYWRHWRYNRADPHVQSFFRSVPMYAQWDDHEVINDFGALWDYWNVDNIDRPGFPNLNVCPLCLL